MREALEEGAEFAANAFIRNFAGIEKDPGRLEVMRKCFRNGWLAGWVAGHKDSR
jgi:hypothetical protein